MGRIKRQKVRMTFKSNPKKGWVQSDWPTLPVLVLKNHFLLAKTYFEHNFLKCPSVWQEKFVQPREKKMWVMDPDLDGPLAVVGELVLA